MMRSSCMTLTVRHRNAQVRLTQPKTINIGTAFLLRTGFRLFCTKFDNYDSLLQFITECYRILGVLFIRGQERGMRRIHISDYWHSFFTTQSDFYLAEICQSKWLENLSTNHKNQVLLIKLKPSLQVYAALNWNSITKCISNHSLGVCSRGVDMPNFWVFQ